MRTHKPSTNRTRQTDPSDLDRRIDQLIQKHPELIDGRLIWSKEVIEDSEALSKEIINSFRERLTP